MPISVFGSSNDNISSNKIDTSSFVQKPYLRTNYIEADIEEDIDMKNKYYIKNLPKPVDSNNAVSKSYVDEKINDPSIIRNNYPSDQINFNNKNLDNVRFVKVNSYPAVREHLTPKIYVDENIRYSVDEQTLLRLDPDEKLKLDVQDFIILNSNLTSPKSIIKIPLNIHLAKTNIDNDFQNNRLSNISRVSVNSQPIEKNDLTTKSYVDSYHNLQEKNLLLLLSLSNPQILRDAKFSAEDIAMLFMVGTQKVLSLKEDYDNSKKETEEQ